MSRVAASIALALLVGCGGGSDADRPGPPSSGWGTDGPAPPVPRAVVVDETPRPDVDSVRLLIVGYQPAQIDSDRPAEGVVPPFFWISPELPAEWPLTFDAPIMSGLRLLAVRDIDGNGHPSEADRRSAVLPVADDPDEMLRFVIDRSFIEGGAADAVPRVERPASDAEPGPGAPRMEPPPSGLALSPGGMEMQPRTLRATSGTPDRKPVPGQRLMIVGFAAGGLNDGLPVPGTRPAYFWNKPHAATDWPLELPAVPLPTGLDLIVVLDTDGDGMPSPRDLAAAPLAGFEPPAVDQVVEVVLDRQFAPEEVAGGGDGDDDDGGDGEEGFGPDGELPDPGEGAARGAMRPINVDSQPRVPFLRNGVLMIVGYAPEDVDRGNPRERAVPKFFWSSDDLQLTWPLQLEVPLPTGGLTMFIVLDLDSDRRPSPGDLSSEPFVNFEPGDPGVDVEVVLQKAFGLAGPMDVPGTEDEGDGEDGDGEGEE